MSTTAMREHLEGWGCPPEYARDWPGGYAVSAEEHAVTLAANWYSDQAHALHAMVIAGDCAAIREWGASPNWDTIARETGTGDETEGQDWVDDVREAFERLAASLEAATP